MTTARGSRTTSGQKPQLPPNRKTCGTPWPNSRQTRPNAGKVWPTSDQLRPISPPFLPDCKSECCPELGPMLTDQQIDEVRPEFTRFRADFATMSAQSELLLVDSAHVLLNLARGRCTSAAKTNPPSAIPLPEYNMTSCRRTAHAGPAPEMLFTNMHRNAPMVFFCAPLRASAKYDEARERLASRPLRINPPHRNANNRRRLASQSPDPSRRAMSTTRRNESASQGADLDENWSW